MVSAGVATDGKTAEMIAATAGRIAGTAGSSSAGWVNSRT
jgi:hypothetical protein